MTNFLHWRKMTWVLLLWSASVATWTVVTGPGPAMAALSWFVGTVAFGLLWLGTQPLFQQGRGLDGMFLRPGWMQWRVVDLHRSHTATEPDAMPTENELQRHHQASQRSAR